MPLTRDEMLMRARSYIRAYEDVPVPMYGVDENGEPVKIRVMAPTLDLSDYFEEKQVRGSKVSPRGIRARWLIMCCVNPDGTQMFTEDDYETLKELALGPLRGVVEAARRISNAQTSLPDRVKN